MHPKYLNFIERTTEINSLESICNTWQPHYLHVHMVLGEAGSGKTQFIQAFRDQLLKKKSQLVWGYGQWTSESSGQPFRALQHAIDSLLDYVALQTPAVRQDFSTHMKSQLAHQQTVFSRLYPKAVRILGLEPATEASKTPATDISYQAILLFQLRTFFCELAKLGRIIIVLDDLHWLDPASNKLLAEIMRMALEFPILLIGAARNDAWSEIPTYYDIKETLLTHPVSYSETILNGFPPSAIAEWLAGQFTAAAADENPDFVSQKLWRCTRGNPLYLQKLVKQMMENKVLYEQDGWTWDHQRLDEWPIFENVVSFLADDLHHLPQTKQQLLALAALAGPQMPSGLLENAMAIWKAPHQTNMHTQLEELVTTGYLQHVPESNYKEFRFSHARIEEAALLLWDDFSSEIKTAAHTRIGHWFLDSYDQTANQSDLIQALQHIKKNTAAIPAHDRLVRAEQFCQAGDWHLNSSHFQDSYSFFTTGIQLATTAPNRPDSTLLLQLKLGLAQALSLSGKPSEALQILDNQLQNCTHPVEKAKILSARTIIGMMLPNGVIVALQSGQQALKNLGIPIPKSNITLAANTIRLLSGELWKLRHRSNAALTKTTTGPLSEREEMTYSISRHMNLASYAGARLLSLYLAILLFIKSAQSHSASPYTAQNYMMFALLLSSLGLKKTSRRIAEAAIEMDPLFPDSGLSAEILSIYHCTISHWHCDYGLVSRGIDRSLQLAIVNGNIKFIGINLCHVINLALFTGTPLHTIQTQLSDSFHNALITHLELGDLCRKTQRFWITQLISPAPDQTAAWTAFFNSIAKQLNAQSKSVIACIYTSMLFSSFFADNPSLSLSYANTVWKVRRVSVALYYYPFLLTFYALTLFANWDSFSRLQRFGYSRKIRKIRSQLHAWAQDCPANFAALSLLCDAQWHQVSGQFWQACQGYQAILARNCPDYLKAFAHEQLSNLFFSEPSLAQSRHHLQEAINRYSAWGASTKTARLSEHYRQRFHQLPPSMHSGTLHSQVDYQQLIAMIQHMSDSKGLSELFARTLMHLIPAAGAEKGIIALISEDHLTPVLGTHMDANGLITTIFDTKTLHYLTPAAQLAVQIAQPVQVDDATQDPRFYQDPYVVANHPRSILALPIKSDSQCHGVMYLENNALPHAFESHAITTCQVITDQLATLLHNATLMHQLQETHDHLIQTEKLAAIGQHSSKMIHELKNSVSLVSTYLTQLPARLTDHQFLNQMAHDLPDELAQWLQMLGDISTFTKPNQFELKPVDIQETLSLFLPKLAEKCRAHRIALTHTFCATPIQIRADAGKLNQVILNLVLNSIDAMPKGGEIHLTSEIQSLPKPTWVLTLTDTGPGIHEKMQNTLFLPFHTNKSGHIGLGLSICREILLGHQGQLEWLPVEKGGCFQMRVPCV